MAIFPPPLGCPPRHSQGQGPHLWPGFIAGAVRGSLLLWDSGQLPPRASLAQYKAGSTRDPVSIGSWVSITSSLGQVQVLKCSSSKRFSSGRTKSSQEKTAGPPDPQGHVDPFSPRHSSAKGWINLDVFSNKKCRCRPNSPGPEMTANLHFLIKLAASFYERGLGYANQMVVYGRLGEFGNKFHKC